jgi:hypothetical protein
MTAPVEICGTGEGAGGEGEMGWKRRGEGNPGSKRVMSGESRPGADERCGSGSGVVLGIWTRLFGLHGHITKTGA